MGSAEQLDPVKHYQEWAVSQAPHHLSPPSNLSSTSVLLLTLFTRPPRPRPLSTPFSAHMLSKAVVREMVGRVKDLGATKQGRSAVDGGSDVSRGLAPFS